MRTCIKKINLWAITAVATVTKAPLAKALTTATPPATTAKPTPIPINPSTEQIAAPTALAPQHAKPKQMYTTKTVI
ncbi:hypothetical protein OUZ56_000135 [Daphnia magna]|uniref:Uncharacterized protein n=1 Tax=Daphnia magna TaxID=35525 RepID=A0ABQ9ZYT4_9CRUS|nr:hypothetical protein OUZ56_000135 [Daphnia magna]